jgi:hypothetical protein
MSIVSHNTDGMRDWASVMDTNAGDYDSLINRLYNLVEGFAGSEQFRGGLSTDLIDRMADLKPQFLKYSSTFRDCTDLIKSRAKAIDADESNLKGRIEKANPLDGNY